MISYTARPFTSEEIMYSKYHEMDTTKVIVLYYFFKVEWPSMSYRHSFPTSGSTVDTAALVPPTVQSNGYGTLSLRKNRHIL